MAQESQDRIGRFDKVQLLTIKNVKYISSPVDNPTAEGVWTVVGIVDDELMLNKGPILIRIPSNDVLKVVDYEEIMQQVYSRLGSLAEDVER